MQPNPFEALPETVEVDGRTYRMNPDFRVGVAFETEMLSVEPDVAGLLALFYPEGVPENVQAAADKLLWFYTCPADKSTEESAGAAHTTARFYDFSQDVDALTASFRQAYGIDLEHDKLHWWKFRRLMFGLPPDTPFMQRVHYRTADINKLPKEQRKHYRKMKRLYALHQPETPRGRHTAAERDNHMKEQLQKRFEQVQQGAKEG